MMGSVATARLGSISCRPQPVVGHADRRARILVVSEPHAAVGRREAADLAVA